LFIGQDEIGAIGVRLGIPLSIDYVPTRQRNINPMRSAMTFVVNLITGALLAFSFLPLQPM